jgi:phosphoribosylformylglycinamidine cyclo-ligase
MSTPEGFDRPLGELLLEPHRSYFKALWSLLEVGEIHSMAHITGGGIPGNLCRVIPAGLQAHVDTSAWRVPPLFELLADKTQAPRAELFRAFNMGVGMVVCVDPSDVSSVLDSLASEDCEAWEIGEIVERAEGAAAVGLDGIG